MDKPGVIAIVGAIAGLVSGVVSALLKWLFDEQIQKQRLGAELNNARQLKLIDAQLALLNDLGDACWNWRYAAMQVVYYGSGSEKDTYEQAVKSYVDNRWRYLTEIRTLGTRAGRLISTTAPKEIEDFYNEIDGVGITVDNAIRETDSTRRAGLFGEVSGTVENDIRTKIQTLIQGLAKHVGLVPPD